MIKYLEKEDFDKEIEGSTILVDFYADWCGPCKMMGSILESIKTIDILKVNVDTHEDLARQFGIMSIPTMGLFKNGELVNKMVGYHNQDEIEQFIKENK